MSPKVMQELLNIAYWYASPGGTFIRIFGSEKPPHELPRFSTQKMVMQEVTYHISTGLSIGLHRRKKTPWPTLPLQIGLYKIRTLKDADAKVKELKKFGFSTKNFNMYDAHCTCKNHCVKVYQPWIDEACHCREEDPWRYCYNSSRLNEPLNIVVEWKETLQAPPPQEVKKTTTIRSTLV